MIDFVIDTNILIYCSQKQEKYAQFLDRLINKKFGISSISVIELLVGARDELEFLSLSVFMESFIVLPVDKEISSRVARALLHREPKSLKNSHVADICIAETALFFGVPLITNNSRDFKTWKTLHTITP